MRRIGPAPPCRALVRSTRTSLGGLLVNAADYGLSGPGQGDARKWVCLSILQILLPSLDPLRRKPQLLLVESILVWRARLLSGAR